MQRNIPIAGAIVGLALLTGCGPSVQHLDGPAVPVGAASSSSAAAANGPSSSPAASHPVTPSAVPGPSRSVSGAPQPQPGKTAATDPVLGPTALGKLRIGMTVSEARATGLIVGYRDGGTACGSSTLRGAPTGAGMVVHSPRRGVVAISAYGSTRTPEGIGIGSALDEVKRAYADLSPSEADDTLNRGSGRLWANLHDGDKVGYRMMIRGKMVVELAIEHVDQDCYE